MAAACALTTRQGPASPHDGTWRLALLTDAYEGDSAKGRDRLFFTGRGRLKVERKRLSTDGSPR